MDAPFTAEELAMLHSAVRSKIHHWNEETQRSALGGDPFARDAHNKYQALSDKVLRKQQQATRAQKQVANGG